MKVVYLTDGRTRTVQAGKRQIILKRTTPRNMATAGKISGLMIQALRHLGRKNVDQQVIAQLDRRYHSFTGRSEKRTMVIAQHGEAKAVLQDIASYKQTQEHPGKPLM